MSKHRQGAAAPRMQGFLKRKEQKTNVQRHSIICICFVLLFSVKAVAQISDIARLDLTHLPTENEGRYTRYRAELNVPIPLKKEGAYFFVGAEYGRMELDLAEGVGVDTDLLNSFHKLKVNFAFTSPLKNNWRIGVQFTPQLSTNAALAQLTTRELVYDGLLLFYKDNTANENVEKPYKLMLGISYATNSSVSFPLPLISYYRKFHPKWSYSIGVPKSNLQYHFSVKDRLKVFSQLDGFGATLTDEIPLENNQIANAMNMTLILSGLQYEHYFTKHLQGYARVGYVWSQSIKLRRGNEKLLRIQGANRYYLRTGIRFKI